MPLAPWAVERSPGFGAPWLRWQVTRRSPGRSRPCGAFARCQASTPPPSNSGRWRLCSTTVAQLLAALRGSGGRACPRSETALAVRLWLSDSAPPTNDASRACGRRRSACCADRSHSGDALAVARACQGCGKVLGFVLCHCQEEHLNKQPQRMALLFQLPS